MLALNANHRQDLHSGVFHAIVDTATTSHLNYGCAPVKESLHNFLTRQRATWSQRLALCRHICCRDATRCSATMRRCASTCTRTGRACTCVRSAGKLLSKVQSWSVTCWCTPAKSRSRWVSALVLKQSIVCREVVEVVSWQEDHVNGGNLLIRYTSVENVYLIGKIWPDCVSGRTFSNYVFLVVMFENLRLSLDGVI